MNRIRHVRFNGLLLVVLLAAAVLAACSRRERHGGCEPLFECDGFALWPDSVAQADGAWAAVSGDSIRWGRSCPVGWSHQVAAISGQFPHYESSQPLIDCMFNRAVEHLADPDALDSVAPASMAVAVAVAVAQISPEAAFEVLRRRVGAGGRIMQPPGPGGSWPVTADRIAWAMGAWEVYAFTGDQRWLDEAKRVLEATLGDDMAVLPDSAYGLMRGAVAGGQRGSGRYPAWMDAVGRFATMNLPNNIFFVEAFRIMSRFEAAGSRRRRNGGQARWAGMASALASSIRERFWMPDRNHLSAYLYGCPFAIQSPQTDNFAQALAVMGGVATPEMAWSITGADPSVASGVPRLHPFAAGKKAGPDDVCDPLTQSLWNMALALCRRSDRLEEGIAAQCRASVLGPSAGRAESAAADIALVTRVFFGMTADTAGLAFAPAVPPRFGGVKRLSGLRYRDATLDITLTGTGNIVAAFAIDSVVMSSNVVPPDLSGHHSVVITLANNLPAAAKPAAVASGCCDTLPPPPSVTWLKPRHAAIRRPKDGNATYLYLNSALSDSVRLGSVRLAPSRGVEQVAAVTAAPGRYGTGPLMSYSAPIHTILPPGGVTELKATWFARGGSRLIARRDSSRNYVELTRTRNTRYRFVVDAPAEGRYYIDMLYSNGSSEDDGGTKCALRTLSVNGRRAGTIVMPQRGAATWDRTARSSMVAVDLKKGRNRLSLDYLEPVDINMNRRVNSALLRSIRIIRTE